MQLNELLKVNINKAQQMTLKQEDSRIKFITYFKILFEGHNCWALIFNVQFCFHLF